MATSTLPTEGTVKTLTASGSVSAHRFVLATGAQAGANANTFGVSFDAATTGNPVAVVTEGTAFIELGSGGITANAKIKTDADGKGVAQDSTNPIVARSLEAGSEGDIVKCVLIPN